MTIHLGELYEAAADRAELATSPFVNGLSGSDILTIAAEVRTLRAQGRKVHNLTVGDFDPSVFPIPETLRDAIIEELQAGHTNYPPSVGTPELRRAVTELYRRELDLDVPIDAVIVGSGARPPIHSAFQAIVAEGDTVIYPVPSWNTHHYCYLMKAKGIAIVTKPEDGFMMTAEAVEPHLRDARLICLNSPQNPSGAVISEEHLAGLCDVILAENIRREATGERPLMMLYDAVYWRLTFGDLVHHTPMALRPEIAPYVVMVDAVSKWMAGTGLRVGWGIAPPWVRSRMQALTEHMGAWAPRPAQLAAARVMSDPDGLGDFLPHFKRQLRQRLERLQHGLEDMARDGLPVDCLPAAGALYLSLRLDLLGRTTPEGVTLDTDEAIRSWILHTAGVAVVPFTAFGYPAGTGWMRMSVGSVSMDDVAATLAALREALESLP